MAKKNLLSAGGMYKMTRRASKLWEDGGSFGDDFRRSQRRALEREAIRRRISAIEVYSFDMIVMDAWDTEFPDEREAEIQRGEEEHARSRERARVNAAAIAERKAEG